jgi:hypothetical protein
MDFIRYTTLTSDYSSRNTGEVKSNFSGQINHYNYLGEYFLVSLQIPVIVSSLFRFKVISLFVDKLYNHFALERGAQFDRILHYTLNFVNLNIPIEERNNLDLSLLGIVYSSKILRMLSLLNAFLITWDL